MPGKKWITIRQTIDLLEVSDKTIRNRIKQKRYRFKRVKTQFGRQIFILREDVEKDYQGSESHGKEDVSPAIPTQTEQTPGTAPSHPEPEKDLVEQTVLVADESETMVQFLSGLLKNQSMNVLTALDGQKTWEMIQARKPDLIIMEPALPIMDGFQLAAEMGLDETTHYIPLIFCSYQKERTIVNQGLNFPNVVRYFTKPLLGKQLKEFKQFIRQRKWRTAVGGEK